MKAPGTGFLFSALMSAAVVLGTIYVYNRFSKSNVSALGAKKAA